MSQKIAALFIFPVLVAFAGFSQEIAVSKKPLNKLFKKSIKEFTHHPYNYSYTHEWSICGTDSSMQTADTVRMLNCSSPNEAHCCHSISWIFYKKHFFRTNETFRCTEPPISTVIIPDHYYRIKLKTANHKLHLNVFKSGKMVYDFVIVRMEYITEGYRKYALITMVKRPAHVI